MAVTDQPYCQCNIASDSMRLETGFHHDRMCFMHSDYSAFTDQPAQEPGSQPLPKRMDGAAIRMHEAVRLITAQVETLRQENAGLVIECEVLKADANALRQELAEAKAALNYQLGETASYRKLSISHAKAARQAESALAEARRGHNEHDERWEYLKSLKKDDAIGTAFAMLEASILHHYLERDGWEPSDTCYMETTQEARALIETTHESALAAERERVKALEAGIGKAYESLREGNRRRAVQWLTKLLPDIETGALSSLHPTQQEPSEEIS